MTPADKLREAAQLAPRALNEPHLYVMPGFHGCTHSDPDLCACADPGVTCAACEEQIEDGESAYVVRQLGCPWLDAHDPDQDFSDVHWHERCDGRRAGSVAEPLAAWLELRASRAGLILSPEDETSAALALADALGVGGETE